MLCPISSCGLILYCEYNVGTLLFLHFYQMKYADLLAPLVRAFHYVCQ